MRRGIGRGFAVLVAAGSLAGSGAGLAGQKIPVTRVRNGDYCVVITADPDNLLAESDETDNVSRVPVHLQGATVSVIGSTC